MNKNTVRNIDFLILAIALGILTTFALSEGLLAAYKSFNQNHGLITSFLKFGLLATFGEVLGQRIRNKNYALKNFGIVPKMIIWGFIGISIKLAFIIFTVGTPAFLNYIGITGAEQVVQNPLTGIKVFTAFSISVAMNVIYAPLMMTFHKITDLHVNAYQGKIISIIKPLRIAQLLREIDWDIQWNFVLKKTIPLFWIPAHTLTFLLPADYQVLFAALLSVALGMILATASLKSK